MLTFLRPDQLSTNVLQIIKNAASLGMARTGTRVLSLVYMLALTRQAGTAAVGSYTLATSIGGYFFLLADFGLNNYVIQQASSDGGKLESLFNSALKHKLLGLALVVPSIIGLSTIMGTDHVQTILIASISLGFVATSFSNLNYAVLRSKEQMTAESVLSLGSSITFVLLAYVLLQRTKLIYLIGISYLFSTILELWISSALRGRVYFRADLSTVVDWRLTTKTLPYGVTSLVSTAFTQIDVIIIAVIASVTVIGEYSVVSRLLLTTTIIPTVVGSAIWPRTANLYTRHLNRFRELVTWSLGFSLLIAAALTSYLFGASREILSILYGKEYVYLSPLLQTGALFIVFKFANINIGFALTSAGRQNARAWAVFAGLIVTITLVLVLVPRFGAYGAILALVCSEITLGLTTILLGRDLFCWKYLILLIVSLVIVAVLNFLARRWLLSAVSPYDWLVVSAIIASLSVMVILPLWFLLYKYVQHRD